MREGENLDIEDREHIHVPTCIWCFFLKWDKKHTDSNNNLKYSESKKDPNHFKRINQVIIKLVK